MAMQFATLPGIVRLGQNVPHSLIKLPFFWFVVHKGGGVRELGNYGSILSYEAFSFNFTINAYNY